MTEQTRPDVPQRFDKPFGNHEYRFREVDRYVVRAEARMDALEARNRELEEAAKIIICSWCGHTESRDGLSIEQVLVKMAEHIETCEKHPLHQAMDRITELEQQLSDVWEEGQRLKKELATARGLLGEVAEWMEGVEMHGSIRNRITDYFVKPEDADTPEGEG